jgi:hypothetical protein
MTKATKTTKAAATPAVVAQPIVKPNARAHLRTMFDKVGAVATKEQVFGIAQGPVVNGKPTDLYKPVTINTHLTDFKNPKYAGKAGVMSVVKMTDGTYKRVA